MASTSTSTFTCTSTWTVTIAMMALGLSTCGGAAQVRPDQAATARVAAVSKAHADDTEFVVRLNPAPCECPAFEVRLDGVYRRVFLDPADPEGPAAAVRSFLETAAGRGDVTATATVAGRLARGPRAAASREQCLVLKVDHLCPPGGCVQPQK